MMDRMFLLKNIIGGMCVRLKRCCLDENENGCERELRDEKVIRQKGEKNETDNHMQNCKDKK